MIETALSEEMTERLGNEKHDPAGAGTGNIRNGTRAKTVLTEKTGQVEIDVPRDRAGTFEPQIARKRQRRLNGVDEIVLSLYAKGLTTGEISAHFAEIYGASVRKETISRITAQLSQFGEQRREVLLGVLHHPGLDHIPAVVDEADTVQSRTPIPSTEHPLTSRQDIAGGAGPTVGSSLFGPRWGCSLAPITLPGNDEGDQLKQAIQWRDIEAVPRRSRRTGQRDLQDPYSSNEAALDLPIGQALCAAPFGVVASAGVISQSAVGDVVQCAVQRAVAAPVEAVPGGAATAGLKRAGAGECGEGGLAPDPAGVAEADHRLGGADWANTDPAGEPIGPDEWLRCAGPCLREWRARCPAVA